jgi:hypothetical protein
MELRVLHSAARQRTWYGQWRYGFGRGGFNMTPAQVGMRRRVPAGVVGEVGGRVAAGVRGGVGRFCSMLGRGGKGS